MKQYHQLLRDILDKGVRKDDRTGTGTTSLFGYQMEFDLGQGFPLQTTKRVFWRGVVEELLWILRGETNIESLKERGVNIWNEWADKNGDLGPVYGAQWREWSDGYFHTDQIVEVINRIRKDPDSRRLIVTAWNPSDVGACRLAPCHILFQFYTRPMTLEQRWLSVANPNDLKRFHTLTPENAERLLDEAGAPSRYLDCQLYQRSADAFLGVPFNIASYSLLTEMIANITGLKSGRFVHTFGDVHIYSNHMDQVNEVLSREPRPLPNLIIKKYAKEIDDFTSFDDFALDGYNPHPPIVAEVAV